MTTVIAFDVFGTVVDFSKVERCDVIDYMRQIREPFWHPLVLPKSWEYLPAHPDSAEGIRRLRQKFIVVTCSNGPLGMLAKLSKNAGIEWDAIIPLELSHAYKPDPKAYMTVCEALKVPPQQVMMVTANKESGDLEASRKLGMTPMLIRHPHCPATIIELADTIQDYMIEGHK